MELLLSPLRLFFAGIIILFALAAWAILLVLAVLIIAIVV